MIVARTWILDRQSSHKSVESVTATSITPWPGYSSFSASGIPQWPPVEVKPILRLPLEKDVEAMGSLSPMSLALATKPTQADRLFEWLFTAVTPVALATSVKVAPIPMLLYEGY